MPSTTRQRRCAPWHGRVRQARRSSLPAAAGPTWNTVTAPPEPRSALDSRRLSRTWQLRIARRSGGMPRCAEACCPRWPFRCVARAACSVPSASTGERRKHSIRPSWSFWKTHQRSRFWHQGPTRPSRDAGACAAAAANARGDRAGAGQHRRAPRSLHGGAPAQRRRLAAAIAQEMGLPKDDVAGMTAAGMIRDIGNIQVPAEILSKPGRLTRSRTCCSSASQIGFDIGGNRSTSPGRLPR